MKKVIDKLPVKVSKPLMPPFWALRSVISKNGKAVYASTDTLFKGAIFGRDSLEVAEDLMAFKPRLVRHILLTLASLQGVETNDLSEEEQGKIAHEYRTTVVDGKPLKGVSKHIFEELAGRWGGSENKMVYYGSIDATPHFIRVLCMYCDMHGEHILNELIKRHDGNSVTLRSVLYASVDWVQSKLNGSSTGLLEYLRRNPHGIENQVWKDSKEFYVHEDGVLANYTKPIASIEVQGLTYDALTLVSTYIPERKTELVEQALQLRGRTIELLWQPDRNYFALGMDYDDIGKPRRIETMTANPAALLDSSFFNDLPAQESQKYVESVVKAIMGHEFLTDAGIRSRALSEQKVIPYWDYHGSFTVWPKETYDVAKGLRRQGFPKLANELENRLLNVVRRGRNYPEFVYVDARGRVLSGPPSATQHGELILVESTNKPENVQAWTVSAVVAILASRLPRFRKQKYQQEQWQIDLEKQILRDIPRVRMLRSSWALAARYPEYPYFLNKSK